VIQSFKKEGSNKDGDILSSIIDPLSGEIKNFLIISRLKKEVYIDPERTGSSDSPEAYQLFTYGQKAFAQGDFTEAIEMLSKAVKIDSNLTYAILHIGWAYINLGKFDEAKKWCLIAYRKRDQMPLNQATYTNFVHARFFGTPNEAIKYLKQLQDIDDQWPHLHYDMGRTFSIMQQYERAVPEYERALEMYTKNHSKPWWPSNYTNLGIAYHAIGQFKEEKILYNKALQDFPENPLIIKRQAILALSVGDSAEANKYIEKYISVRKDNSSAEANILTDLAGIYEEAGVPGKAEANYQKVLSLQPDDQESLFNLGWFLIDKKGDISKGLELVGKVLKSDPENYEYLDAKGWGLYKQGKFNDALETLEKSWVVRMKNGIYNYPAYLHMEAAKKAVSTQK
jgi:tetratricopeptide (TPR) repeat protein